MICTDTNNYVNVLSTIKKETGKKNGGVGASLIGGGAS